MGSMPQTVIAIDPGDEHVGLAGWRAWEEEISAVEAPASEAPDEIALLLTSAARNGVRIHLVIEEFVLYPWAAVQQSWSPMLTAEMIGMLKWEARRTGATWSTQGANIKKPMAAQLRGRGIRRVGVGTHASDAELHLYHYLLKEGLWRT